jgi:hypothetical protein
VEASISSYGVPVLCVDNSKEELAHVESIGASISTKQSDGHNLLSTLHFDLINDPWPFQNESLGAIII